MNKAVLCATDVALNRVFAALADPTRRAILARLAEGQARVGDLVGAFQMSQPAISKHLKVLEKAGLVGRASIAQSRPAYLRAEPMQRAVNWLAEYRVFWSNRFDQLDALLVELQQPDTPDNPNKEGCDHA